MTACTISDVLRALYRRAQTRGGKSEVATWIYEHLSECEDCRKERHMKIGMLWYDNSQDELQTKIAKATEYYAEKYNKQASLVYVHPSMVAEDWQPLAGIEVKTSHQVLPNHIWVGVA